MATEQAEELRGQEQAPEQEQADTSAPPPPAPLPSDASSSSASQSDAYPVLEADSSSGATSDADSAVGTFASASTTTSVRSSIYEFEEEYGRTYHRYKEGKYVLPNDATEQDRLDLQHHLLCLTLDGRLYLAPLDKDVHHVLDIGTGTGIWAIEFATSHPTARVVGTDLSPIQPNFVPPNCQFEIDDAEDTWTFTTPFDFIHARGMMTCFRSPADVWAQAFAHLRPGGWIELQDAVWPLGCIDASIHGTALERWGNACVDASIRLGRPWTNAPFYKQMLLDIGFVDVHERKYQWPTNTWPRGARAKELGAWTHQNLLDAVGASMRVLTHGLGWSKEEVELLLVEVRNDLRDRKVHAFMPIYVVWGRKPEHATDSGS